MHLFHARATPLILAGVLACSPAVVDPVEQLRAELELAAEARDADRFAERLSPDFQGPHGLTRAEGLASLRRYFAAYESVDLDVYGVEVEGDETRARVRCVVEFSGRPRPLGALKGLLPPAAVYRFDLLAAEDSGVWRVREAAWVLVVPDDEG
jgi:hypothetical protein